MEHDREARQLLGDFLQNVKAQMRFALELERAVAGADGDGQRVNAGRLHKFLNLVGIGVKRVVVADFHVVLNAGQTAQLALNHNAVIVRILDHLTGQLDVLFKRQMRAVDHDGGEAAVDAGLAGFKIRAVIQVQHDRQIYAALLRVQQSGLNQLHQIHMLGISARALGNLKNHRRLFHRSRLGDALNDFHVVDVERADGIVAFIRFLKHLGRGNKTH